MIFTRQCKKDYIQNFPTDWIENLDWNSIEASMQSLKTGFSIINNFQNTCFVLLSKSALSGGYIGKMDAMPSLLNEIKDLTANEYSPPATSTENELKIRLYAKYQDLDTNLRICLTYYHSLYSVSSNKISAYNHDFMFNKFAIRGDFSKNCVLVDFAQLVVPLCKLDHYLSFAKKDISDLILKREDLNEKKDKQTEQLNPIYKALHHKSSFLLKKMLHVSGKSEYCFNFKTYQIKKEDINIESTSFQYLYDKFEYLHALESDKEKVLQWQEKCELGTITLSEIITLMKSYQKNKGTLQQINNLLTHFDVIQKKKIAKRKKEFNRYALNTTKNYLYNCRLSYKIIQKKYTFETLTSDMQEIEDIQSETSIRNFYPYRKAIIFLFKDISNDLLEKKLYENEDVLFDKITVLGDYISKIKESLKWCENQDFYPFQLVFNDCCVRYQDLDMFLFIPSSFARPIDYAPLMDELEVFKTKYVFLEQKIELLKETKKIKAIKDDLSKSGKRNIEILGVFTAVITFLFGTVNLFTTTKTLQELIRSSLALGVILLLFTSSIYFLTIPKHAKIQDYLLHPRFWFFGIASIIYFIILLKTVT